MFAVGNRLKNKHTGQEYTVCEVIIMDFGLTVYEISTDSMQTLRFNQDYSQHYQVIS
jgi:hypothetical protein